MDKNDSEEPDDLTEALKVMDFQNIQNSGYFYSPSTPAANLRRFSLRPPFLFRYPPVNAIIPEDFNVKYDPITLQQFQILEKVYFKTKFISQLREKELATETGLTDKQVRDWFATRQEELSSTNGRDNDVSRKKVDKKVHFPPDDLTTTPVPNVIAEHDPLISSMFYNSMCAMVAVEFTLNDPNHPIYFRTRLPSTAISSEQTMNAFKVAANKLLMRPVSSFKYLLATASIYEDHTTKTINFREDFPKPRTIYYWHQLFGLELKFKEAEYLELADQKCLAAELGLYQKDVEIWFEIRREIEKENRLKSESTESNGAGEKLPTVSNKSTIVTEEKEEEKFKTCGCVELFSQLSNYVMSKFKRTSKHLAKKS